MALPGTRATITNCEIVFPEGGRHMVDIALAAAAVISVAMAAMVIATDRYAIKRHVDDY
jgi:hypothetical protein